MVEGWDSKSGKWADEAEVISARAGVARRWLAACVRDKQGDVAVVTHGTFLHYLTEDWEGVDDLAGTGWRNTEVRSFVLQEREGGEVGFVETDESSASRRGLRGQSTLGEQEQATGPAVEEGKAAEVSVRA